MSGVKVVCLQIQILQTLRKEVQKVAVPLANQLVDMPKKGAGGREEKKSFWGKFCCRLSKVAAGTRR